MSNRIHNKVIEWY